MSEIRELIATLRQWASVQPTGQLSKTIYTSLANKIEKAVNDDPIELLEKKGGTLQLDGPDQYHITHIAWDYLGLSEEVEWSKKGITMEEIRKAAERMLLKIEHYQ